MPIYQYRCEACGHDLEVLQKVGDALLTRCPQCEEDRLRKQLTAAGFRLKGSGWYETDFKGEKPRKQEDKKKAEPKTDQGGPSQDKTEKKASGGDVSRAGASGRQGEAPQ